jgi:hypothetical protein
LVVRGAFVGGHGLGVFEGAAFLQIGGDAGRPEGVAADREGDASFQSAFPNHTPGIDAAQPFLAEGPGLAESRAEEGAALILAEACGLQISMNNNNLVVWCASDEA